MRKGTAADWLHQLDTMNVTDEAWSDPEFVDVVSWVMLMFIPRRLNQRLIDAGFAEAIPGTNLPSR